MRVLLDTHVWLWMLTAPQRLGDSARELVEDRRTAVVLSAVSSWEIAIKHALGRLLLPVPPERYIPERMRAFGVEQLPVEHVHALRVGTLEPHHADPFDRLLVAQSQIERIPLLTADPVFAAYNVDTIAA